MSLNLMDVPKPKTVSLNALAGEPVVTGLRDTTASVDCEQCRDFSELLFSTRLFSTRLESSVA